MKPTSADLQELIQRGYRFALSLTHDPARAEDIAQDAWLAIVKREGPPNAAYLFRVIRNRFIDQYRRQQSAPFEPYANGPVPDEAVVGDDWGPGLEQAPDQASLDDILSYLRSEERAVLFLSAVEGYSASQIASLFEWPRATVLSLLHRAKIKLRQALQTQSGMNT